MITAQSVNEFKRRLCEIAPIVVDTHMHKFSHVRAGTWWKSPSADLYWFMNYKAASTLYRGLFTELGWSSCVSQDVRNPSAAFFGHIMDPLTRHRKGITEVFFYRDEFCNLREKYDISVIDDWITVLSNLHSFDQHCMSIEEQLGDLAKSMYWIPVDTNLDHKKHTLELLDFFGQTVPTKTQEWFLALPRINQSSQEQKNFYQRLCSIAPNNWLLDFLDFDLCVYTTAIYFHDTSLPA